MTTENNQPQIIDLASLPEGTLIKVPGFDKAVAPAQVLSRDQHLTVLNRRNAELEGAEAIANVLATEEGREAFAARLVESGYGHDAFKTLADAGNSTPSNGTPVQQQQAPVIDADQPPAWFKASLDQRDAQIATLMSTVSTLTANLTLKEEIEAVKKVNPDIDLSAAMQLAMEKRGAFNLTDAAVYMSATDKDKVIAEQAEQIRRMELESRLPGISSSLGLGPKVEPRKAISSAADQQQVIKDLILEALDKGVDREPTKS